jgi:hypothetical protein
MVVLVDITGVIVAGEGGTADETPGTRQADISTKNRMAAPTARDRRLIFSGMFPSRKLDGNGVPYGL